MVVSHEPFGFAKPKDSPGFLLWQTTMIWQRLIKKVLEPYGVSHSQFVIMAILLWLSKNKLETTQIQIANWSKLDKMTVSKSLKKLSSEALVKRYENDKDTRAKNVELTGKGRQLVSKLIPLVEKVDEDFFSSLNKKGYNSTIENLRQLVG